MIWCRLLRGSSLGLLDMREHYQKRIEASRYLNRFLNRKILTREKLSLAGKGT